MNMRHVSLWINADGPLCSDSASVEVWYDRQMKSLSKMSAKIPLRWWNISAYMLACSILVAFWFLAEDISCLLTMSAGLQAVGVLGLFDSKQALHPLTANLFIVGLSLRCLVICVTTGYTPIDATGDWLHRCLETISLCLVLVEYGTRPFRNTCLQQEWTTPRQWVIFIAVVAISLLLGYNFHLRLVGYKGTEKTSFYVFDILWAASTYIETVAMIPQVHLMAILGTVQHNAQFVSMAFLSRAVGLWFWLVIYEPMKDVSESRWTALLICGAHGLELLIVCEVAYFFLRDKLAKAKDVIVGEFSSAMSIV